jgi:hypothetical protein
MSKNLPQILDDVERIMPSSTPEERIRIYEKLKTLRSKLKNTSGDTTVGEQYDNGDFLPEK